MDGSDASIYALIHNALPMPLALPPISPPPQSLMVHYQLASPPTAPNPAFKPPAFKPLEIVPAASMSQSLNIRYELDDSVQERLPYRKGASDCVSVSGSISPLLSLYWEGRRVEGYRTIEQFYDDMAMDGWTLESVSRPRSRCQLHFAVMKREL